MILLGGDFWIDVDQFAEQDFEDENIAQNDLLNTNNIIRKGDRFGYDYDIQVNKNNLFSQLEGKLKKIDFFVGVTASYNKILERRKDAKRTFSRKFFRYF